MLSMSYFGGPGTGFGPKKRMKSLLTMFRTLPIIPLLKPESSVCDKFYVSAITCTFESPYPADLSETDSTTGLKSDMAMAATNNTSLIFFYLINI